MRIFFFFKIKTKHRYVWTKREFTEEGSLLGQLVEQVCINFSLFFGTWLYIFASQTFLFHCFISNPSLLFFLLS